ncbi:MAG TPA: transcriptional regulator NrdR [Clostridiales bacterium]|jgi:transcriptional repressor NrdR|nr:transcriptional regulator NrdR [Clostridiales bacterium]
MRCPFCSDPDSKVVDSRAADNGAKIRRRRECTKCKRRFTTYEILEYTPIVVVKKDSSRQAFDSEKLIKGMLRACEKRPVPIDVIKSAVDAIELELHQNNVREVKTEKIGEMVLEKLRKIDDVAYIRFASVYRRFDDVDSFLRELENISKKD